MNEKPIEKLDEAKIAEKEKEIKKTLRKLKQLTACLPTDKQKSIDKLLTSLAFQTVELEELEEYIKVHGTVERYQNGANQYGTKPSSAFGCYVQLNKSYQAGLKLLLATLDEVDGPTARDELASFLMHK